MIPLAPPTSAGRTWRRLAIVLALAATGALASGDAGGQSASSPDSLLTRAAACNDKLYDSAALRKRRNEWERCIRAYREIADRFRGAPAGAEALLRLADLYWGLHGYSGLGADRATARDYYRDYLTAAPDGTDAARARARAGSAAPPAAAAKPAPKLAPQPGAIDAPRNIVQNLRHWTYPGYSRLVLDLRTEADFTTRPGADPTQLRLILPATVMSEQARDRLPALGRSPLNSVTLDWTGPDLAITIAPVNAAQPPKIAPLSNPDRLVIDIFHPSGAEAAGPDAGALPTVAPAAVPAIRTIVIDPGHGGKDPGAIGASGVAEKEIVLDVGLRLRRLIEERLNKTVIMTRDSDVFIPLDDRTLLANSKKADLFVSIHVNSHPSRDTRGVEVYLLGQSSDARARATAARENDVTIESLGNLERSVKQILFDLGRDYNVNQSLDLAHFVKDSFLATVRSRQRYSLYDHGVKRAPFYVLMNSNMPSILAEISFITNPTEERMLRRSDYRQAIAEALFQGVKRYIENVEVAS